MIQIITPRLSARRPAFSLIEVLVAILILALGLLGLGAVFPAVILQQRSAVDAIEGESAASIAEAILQSSPEIISFKSHLLETDGGYWSWFDPEGDFGRDQSFPAGDIRYEWVIPQPQGDTTYSGWPEAPGPRNGNFGDYATGIWYVNQAAATLPDLTKPLEYNQVLTVADRLVPQPYTGKDPQYVWDIAARRQPGTNRPQVAIFVRHIDSRLRVPAGSALSHVLSGGALGANYPLLPVAIDGGTGQPAVDNGDPQFVYAAIQTLQVQVRQDHLDWLIFEDATNFLMDTSISFATKPGQKLVDNTGTVRTVLGPPAFDSSIAILSDLNARVVRVDPPFQFSQGVDRTGNLNATDNDPTTDAERASWVRQVIFTPRTPVTIRMVTLEESSP